MKNKIKFILSLLMLMGLLFSCDLKDGYKYEIGDRVLLIDSTEGTVLRITSYGDIYVIKQKYQTIEVYDNFIIKKIK